MTEDEKRQALFEEVATLVRAWLAREEPVNLAVEAMVSMLGNMCVTRSDSDSLCEHRCEEICRILRINVKERLEMRVRERRIQ